MSSSARRLASSLLSWPSADSHRSRLPDRGHTPEAVQQLSAPPPEAAASQGEQAPLLQSSVERSDEVEAPAPGPSATEPVRQQENPGPAHQMQIEKTVVGQAPSPAPAPAATATVTISDVESPAPLGAAGTQNAPQRRLQEVDLPPALEHRSGEPAVTLRIGNAVCAAFMFAALLLASFAAGYLFREHQDLEAQVLVSAYEHELQLGIVRVERELIKGINSTVHLLPIGRLTTIDPEAQQCLDGLLIAGPSPTMANALLFTSLLLWAFLGVAVFADLFMVAIEHITSQETVRVITLPSGKTHKLTTRICARAMLCHARSGVGVASGSISPGPTPHAAACTAASCARARRESYGGQLDADGARLVCARDTALGDRDRLLWLLCRYCTAPARMHELRCRLRPVTRPRPYGRERVLPHQLSLARPPLAA